MCYEKETQRLPRMLPNETVVLYTLMPEVAWSGQEKHNSSVLGLDTGGSGFDSLIYSDVDGGIIFCCK